LVKYFDFIQFHCILFSFTFTFNAFGSLPQNFGLIRTGSKLENFGLGNGESGKSSILHLQLPKNAALDLPSSM
jgi:hypothetical protein